MSTAEGPSAFGSSARTPRPEAEAARPGSVSNLLKAWEEIGRRRITPLRKDDIVDLSTLTVVKDRGVLSKSKNAPWDVGEREGEEKGWSEGNDVGESEAEEDAEAGGSDCDEQGVRDAFEENGKSEVDVNEGDDEALLQAFLADEDRRKTAGGMDDSSEDDAKRVQPAVAGVSKYGRALTPNDLADDYALACPSGGTVVRSSLVTAKLT